MRPCTAPPIGDDDRYFATRFHRSRVYPRSARMMAQVRKSTSPENAFASKERPMDYRDRHVVVTGGTGALGTAVVSALVEHGAVCHVPYINPSEADRFPMRSHAQVKLVADIELTQEAAVAKLHDGVPQLWASIHIAGGFAMAPLGKTSKADLMQQIEMNFVTAFLC